MILYFIAFCIWLFLIYQFANFSHSSVSLFADHNSKIFGIYNISLKQKEETPQVLPRSQASQVSATRSLYLSYLTSNFMSSNFYRHLYYTSIFIVRYLPPFVSSSKAQKLPLLQAQHLQLRQSTKTDFPIP